MLKKIKNAILDIMVGIVFMGLAILFIGIFGTGLSFVVDSLREFFTGGTFLSNMISMILVIIAFALIFVALPCSLLCFVYSMGKLIRNDIINYRNKRKMEEIKCQENKEKQ